LAGSFFNFVFYVTVFIARLHSNADAILIQQLYLSVCPSVCLSVCLSVTFRHCIETASHVIILSSAYASPVIRVSLALNSFAKFRRGHHYGAAEYTYGI